MAKKTKAPKTQTCTCCGVNKKIHLFGISATAKNGHLRRCKDCVNAQTKARRDAKRDGTWENGAPVDEIQVTLKKRGGQMRSNARKRARKKAKMKNKPKKIVVEITAEEIVQKMNDSGLACERTGILFNFESSDEGEATIFSPSLDRIDPSQGYTVANTQVVISGYNSLKGTGTDLQAMQIAMALVSMNS